MAAHFIWDPIAWPGVGPLWPQQPDRAFGFLNPRAPHEIAEETEPGTLMRMRIIYKKIARRLAFG